MKILRSNGEKVSVGENSQTQNEDWERRTMEKLLLQVYKEQRYNKIWRWVKGIIWIVAIVLIVTSFTRNKDFAASTGQHTAVIELSGVIDNYNDNADKLIKGLSRAYENPNVKGIIIKANSPGGSPVISSVAFDEIRRLKAQHKDIPLYVVAEDVCASGCYYIASAADKIYANPASMVGSIGVISGGFGFTGLMEKAGVERRLRTAGGNKGMGDPFSPENPEQEKIWQTMLDDIHGQFISAVQEGRGKRIDIKKTPDVFSGRVYTGNEAKQVGLIDDYGSIYSVSRDVFKAPQLVDYSEKDDFSKTLGRKFGAQVKQGVQSFDEFSW